MFGLSDACVECALSVIIGFCRGFYWVFVAPLEAISYAVSKCWLRQAE